MYGDRKTYGKIIRCDAMCDGGLCAQQVEILLGEAHNPSDCLPIFEAQTKLVSDVLSILWCFVDAPPADTADEYSREAPLGY